MDLSKLTQEERAALKAQLEAEEKADKAREQKERDTYKELVDSAVRSNVRKLQVLSAEMERVKAEVFGEFAAIIRTKNELFRTKVNRQSDTFTTADGTMSITLGNRVNEGWDDTVEAGIAKVKEYLSTLARDENSAALRRTRCWSWNGWRSRAKTPGSSTASALSSRHTAPCPPASSSA